MARGGLNGNVGDLKSLGARLRGFSTSMVYEVAKQSAPILTRNAVATYNQRRGVYGESFGASKVTGQPLTLKRTGSAYRSVRFEAIGTKIRCVLGRRYTKFLIGKFKILPMGRLPVNWTRDMREIVKGVKF